MIRIQEIYEAYRKMKSYYYYDNTSHFVRKRIAEFEDSLYDAKDDNDFKKRFEGQVSNLVAVLNKEKGWQKKWTEMLDKEVKCVILPKSLEDDAKPEYESVMYVTNKTNIDEIKIGSVNAIIDAPVVIHILSVLWIMRVGLELASLVDKNNYAYQLATHEDNGDEQEIDDGLTIYRPYFIGYQEWRDNALKIAKRLLKDNKDVAIVSLDVKRYFYSVRLNVESMVNELTASKEIKLVANNEDVKHLNYLLNGVHRVFAQSASRYVEEAGMAEDKSSLPVGLMSSGILGNLYLKAFDNMVADKLRPDYYGRYVDDMIFVMSNVTVDSPECFIDKMFCGKDSMLLHKDENGSRDYFISDYQSLKIQSAKVVLEYFEHDGSTALIDKFVNTILRNRSEFRFLPVEDEVNRNFEDSAFSLQYSDSFNKLRSIQNFKEDKFGASRYLANQIFLSSYRGTDKDTEMNDKQILAFFRGSVAISFHTLWEKVATYFIMNNNKNGLEKFMVNVNRAIEGIVLTDENCAVILQKYLKEFLEISVAIPLSLNLGIELLRKYSDIKSLAYKMQQSCLSRRQLMSVAMFDMLEEEVVRNTCLFQINPMAFNEENFKYSDVKRLLSPQYIHLDMLCQIEMLKHIVSWKGSENNLANVVLQNSLMEFDSFNYKWRHLFDNDGKHYGIKSFVRQNVQDSKKHYVDIIEDKGGEIPFPNKTVAIANLKVDTNIIPNMVYGRSCLTSRRKKELFAVINEAVKCKSDLLVMPELSMPYQWLSLLTRESKKANMGIVSGLTYICNKNKIAFNVVAAILPMKIRGRMECIVIPRVKNHYAPREIDMLNGYRFKIPRFDTPVYQLIHWRRLYFTIYNCFELASIEDRSLFKSEAELIIATELNRDINYFSDIAGSWVRDLHAYFIQVNSSEFGDSRIMRPTEKDRRDMVVVKGGKNPIAIIDSIDIDSLRKFQLKEYNLQMQSRNDFKITPPYFDVFKVTKRVNDESMCTE